MIPGMKCSICKNELTRAMGYNWGACDQCAIRVIKEEILQIKIKELNNGK